MKKAATNPARTNLEGIPAEGRLKKFILALGNRDCLLSALSGLILVFSFPKVNGGFLAWVALLPLLWALRGKTPRQAALLGFVAGWVFFTGLLYWIYVVMTEYGHLPPPISAFLLLLLTAYLALYIAAFSFFLGLASGKQEWLKVIFAPFLWVALEYLRGFLLSGFPWEYLGYSQFLTPSIVQIADVTGVYGVSFLIVLVNVCLTRGLSLWAGGKRLNALRPVAVALLAFLPVWFYGQWRLAAIDQRASLAPSHRVALVQGNIPQDVKWEPQFQQETLTVYSDLTRQAGQSHPGLIIWPETATPFFFQVPNPLQAQILALSRQVGAPLLFGAPAFDRRDRRDHYFNSAFLVSPEEKILGRYDKVHLVPFGEYAPMAGVLGFTRDIIGAIGDFTSGAGPRVLDLPWGRFGVLICYEGIFPDLTRQFVDKGGRFLVNITNDAWFGRTSAPYQHLSMITLRAVENRVSIVRAANTGISAVIDPGGRILSATGLFTREVLSGNISLGETSTFYTRYGDLFTYLCLGFTVFFIILLYWKRGQRVE